MNTFVQNIQIYLNIRLFALDYFELFWPFSYFVFFWTHIEPFWSNNYHFQPFLENTKFKYICYYRYWTNEYHNIFDIINRSWMNIQFIRLGKKINKYLNKWIYPSKYIWIYSNIQIFVPHCLECPTVVYYSLFYDRLCELSLLFQCGFSRYLLLLKRCEEGIKWIWEGRKRGKL